MMVMWGFSLLSLSLSLSGVYFAGTCVAIFSDESKEMCFRDGVSKIIIEYESSFRSLGWFSVLDCKGML